MAILGREINTGREIALPPHPRPHTGIFGISGQGKTQMIASAAISDIADGAGVAVWDNHGDLVRQIIANLPPERVPDTVFLDLTDVHRFAPGLNLYACPDPGNAAEVAQVSSFVLHLLELVWGTGLTTAPVMAMVMRHLGHVLIEHGLTLAEAPLVLSVSDDTVREKLTGGLANPHARRYWEEYERMSPRERREHVSSAQNKIDALLSPLMAPILSQTTTLPWRAFLDEGRILLIQGNPLVSEASRLLSALISGQLLLSSFSRITDTPEERRRPYFVYIDEAQAVATRDMAVWLHEARKAGLSLCLATQSVSEYDELMRQAVLSAGTLVVFRVSGEEAKKTFAPSFKHTPVSAIRAPVTDVLGHLLRRGHSSEAVNQLAREYLAALQSWRQRTMGHTEAFDFGCVRLYPAQLADAMHIINDALSRCQQTGRSDHEIHPLGLMVLGGSADATSIEVFKPHMKRSWWNAPGQYLGMKKKAFVYGQGDFLANEQLVAEVLRRHPDRAVRTEFLQPKRVFTPGRSFLRMLRLLRDTMAVLAREPITAESGESPADFLPRSFADAEHMVANEISQLGQFRARVRTLTGEYTIETRPAPRGLTGPALAARVAAIKERMVEEGLLRPVQDIMKETAERHERLQAPASRRSGSGRRLRTSEPPPAD